MKKRRIRQRPNNRFFLLAAVLYRRYGRHARLRSVLEQAVTAAALFFALRAFISVQGMPYAVFLLGGLAPWFYFREVLFSILEEPEGIKSIFGADGYSPSLFPAGQAVAALPTLLLWTGVCLLVALLYGVALQRLWLLLYFVACSACNAAAQGMFAAAFLPLFPAGGSKGLAITMPYFFWTSPIVWPAGNFTGLLLFMMRLNPMYYLADCLRSIVTSGVLPTVEHGAVFFAAVTVTGLVGMRCLRRVWRSSGAVW